MSKPPAFQFYPKQWLGDDQVMLMDWDAKAMHLHLICVAWQREQPCTLPDDEALLRRWLMQPSDDVWTRVWPQIRRAWQKGRGGLLVQRGLLATYLKLMAFKKERSSTGKKGAEKRWLSHSSGIKEPMAKNSSSSSSSSSSSNVKDFPPIAPRGGAEVPAKPKDKKQRTATPDALEGWQDLIGHIDQAWKTKKNVPYPWEPHEFKKLHHLAKTYLASGVMAMWDLYMQMGTYWGKLTGYMIDGLKKDLGVIVDDPRWKALCNKYQADLDEKTVKPTGEEIVETKSLLASLAGQAKSV